MILVRGPSLRSGRIFAVFSAFLATCSRKVLLPRIVATVTEISRDLTTVGSGSGRAERGRMTSGVRFVSAARAMLIALIVLGGVEVPQVALATNVFQQARSKEKYGAFVSGCPCGYDGSSKNANTCQDLCPRPIGIFSAGKTAIHSRFDLSLATRGITTAGLRGRQPAMEMTGTRIKSMAKAMREGRFDWKAGAQVRIAERNGTRIIIDGHHRVAAARRAGLSEIPGTVEQVSDDVWNMLVREAEEAVGR